MKDSFASEEKLTMFQFWGTWAHGKWVYPAQAARIVHKHILPL